MPWNNQNNGGSRGNGGGPWGSGGGGGGGPWGGGPPRGGGGGGGGTPPDLEELLRKSQQRLKNVLPGGGRGPTSGLNRLVIAGVVIFGVLFSGYYFFTFRVQPDELGVVLRFGEFNRQAQSGLNFRLPYPVEEVYLPKVTRVNRITVGYRSADDNRAGRSQDVPEESLMLTGDENIVDIDFTVLWRISDAADYLFNIRNPEGTVKVVAESAMREVVGRSEIQPLLTQARQLTENDVTELMQATLDQYGAGILVTQVQLQQVDPPRQVIDAFRDVQAARADQERAQNEAQAYANKVVPEARGEAARILESANAYKEQTVAEAQGQADRFKQVYNEYAKAPDITRQRMFLETMERVFGGTDKIIIDSSSGEQGVVPYLPLDQLNRRTGASQ